MKKERTPIEELELHIGKNIILLKGTWIFFDPDDTVGNHFTLPTIEGDFEQWSPYIHHFTGKLEGNIQAYELLVGKKFTEKE